MSKSQDFLSSLNEQSCLFGKKATQLSRALEKAEHFLQQIQVKTRITARGNSVYEYLAFEKSRRGVWRFVLSRKYLECDVSFEKHIVTESNMDIKILAAKLLPKLFENLIPGFQSQTSDIEKSLSALEKIPFLPTDD